VSKNLSRAADAVLVRLAEDLEGAVLDNFWYRETAHQLLGHLSSPLVEVCCRCEPEVALARFTARARHPGHADDETDEEVRRASCVARTL
jgi:hypothetical protein